MIEILKGMHETIRYSELAFFRMYHNVEFEDYPAHWHMGVEIIAPRENGYTVVLQNEKVYLNEGDIIIINTGIIHGLEAPETGERIIIQFDIALLNIIKELETLLFMMPPVIVFRAAQATPTYRIVHDCLEKIIKEYDDSKAFHEVFIYAALIEIYGELARREVFRHDMDLDNQLKQQNYVEAILRTCEYINAHYMDSLTLQQVAAVSGFSKFHFSRVFKQFTNKTFYEYLNNKRIQQATLLLSNKELSITQIAMESGFNTISTFNRTFKEVNGRSPSSYRSKKL